MIYSENQNKLTFNSSEVSYIIASNNGGGICSFIQTSISIGGECTFVRNQAHSSGAIYASESDVDVHSKSLLMTNNTDTCSCRRSYILIQNQCYFHY